MSNIARCERGCDPPQPATMLIRAGLEWHPCCDDCGEWWPDHRKSYLANPRGAVNTSLRQVRKALEEIRDERPDDARHTLSFLADWLDHHAGGQ